jgi:hypothetical protein
MAESATNAVAILSHGRWVGLCPTDTNAILLNYGQTRFECASPNGIGADGTTANITWPASTSVIELAVAGLPVEQRNWSPSRRARSGTSTLWLGWPGFRLAR